VGRAFPSWNRSILTEIYLCHACSYQEILRMQTPGQAEQLACAREERRRLEQQLHTLQQPPPSPGAGAGADNRQRRSSGRRRELSERAGGGGGLVETCMVCCKPVPVADYDAHGERCVRRLIGYVTATAAAAGGSAPAQVSSDNIEYTRTHTGAGERE
jgi:hypothetical protein